MGTRAFDRFDATSKHCLHASAVALPVMVSNMLESDLIHPDAV